MAGEGQEDVMRQVLICLFCGWVIWAADITKPTHKWTYITFNPPDVFETRKECKKGKPVRREWMAEFNRERVRLFCIPAGFNPNDG